MTMEDRINDSRPETPSRMSYVHEDHAKDNNVPSNATDAPSDGSAAQLRLSEVDRLRDIIFGSHIEAYERRFGDMQREMERAVTDLRTMQDRVLELEKLQSKRIEAIEEENRRIHDELHREIERQRVRETFVQKLLTQMRQQETATQGLSKLANELRRSVSQQENDLRTLHTTAGEYREQSERTLQTLRLEGRQTTDDLRQEVRLLFDRLDTHKTDRRALAAMLTEIAMRLETGSSVTNLLEDLTLNSRE